MKKFFAGLAIATVWVGPFVIGAARAGADTPSTTSCTAEAAAGTTYTNLSQLSAFGLSCTGLPGGVGAVVGRVDEAFGVFASSTNLAIAFRIFDQGNGQLPSTVRFECTSTTCIADVDGVSIVTMAKIVTGPCTQLVSSCVATNGHVELYGPGPYPSGNVFNATNNLTCASSTDCGQAYFTDDWPPSVGIPTTASLTSALSGGADAVDAIQAAGLVVVTGTAVLVIGGDQLVAWIRRAFGAARRQS